MFAENDRDHTVADGMTGESLMMRSARRRKYAGHWPHSRLPDCWAVADGCVVDRSGNAEVAGASYLMLPASASCRLTLVLPVPRSRTKPRAIPYRKHALRSR